MRSGLGRRRSDGVLVLAYHAIADLPAGDPLHPYSVPPREFEAQLDTLRRRRYRFVDLDAVLALLTQRVQARGPGVLLTFDDCYEDLSTQAVPLLVERGIPAVAFAVAGRLGAFNDWEAGRPPAGPRLLDGRELRQLRASGVEIGAHSVTHPDLTKLDPGQLIPETAGAVDALEAAGLGRPRVFAYPYGRHNPGVVSAVQRAGCQAAFITHTGLVRADSDRYRLPRLEVRRGDTGVRFSVRLMRAAWSRHAAVRN
jgi:peptidoglycan/xylan/chitin deacetylase (PgdA/CDA1 family)